MTAKILFIDDESYVLGGLKRAMHGSGHELSFASSGEEALDIMRDTPIDIVVSDEKMPEMSGSELMKKVRTEFPDTARIILTGHSDMQAAINAINEGKISGYLTKPVDRNKLVKTIEEALTWKHELEIKEDMLRESVLATTWEWDIAKNRISWGANFEELFGSAPREKNGDYKNLFVNVMDKDRQYLVQGIKEVLDTGSSLELEHRIRLTKEIRCISQIIHLLTDRRGEPLKIMGMARDVTSKKNREKQIRDGLAHTRNLLNKSIQALAVVTEQRDAYTAGHQIKVANIAVQIAREMDLDRATQKTVYMAGLLHDIGKNSIPLEYLTKPKRLSVLEMEVIKTHSQKGYDIVRGIPFAGPVAQVILEHHERLDGSGYPHGLKEGEIRLEAKILAVADVYEAISAHRPYRPAKGYESAIHELVDNKDTLYDSKVVHAVKALHDTKRLRTEPEQCTVFIRDLL